MIRTGRDLSTEEFPVSDIANLIRRHKSHAACVQRVKIIAENTKPVKLKAGIKWED